MPPSGFPPGRSSRRSSEDEAAEAKGIGPPVVGVDLDSASEDEVVLIYWEDPFPDMSLGQEVTEVEKDEEEVVTVDKNRSYFSWEETPKRKTRGQGKKKKKQATTPKA